LSPAKERTAGSDGSSSSSGSNDGGGGSSGGRSDDEASDDGNGSDGSSGGCVGPPFNEMLESFIEEGNAAFKRGERGWELGGGDAEFFWGGGVGGDQGGPSGLQALKCYSRAL
jgi:hypothetical protein